MAIVDPGPNDDAHLAALIGAVLGNASLISSSPTPIATTARWPARLGSATGAPIVGAARPHRAPRRAARAWTPPTIIGLRAGPVLADGETIRFGGVDADGARDARTRGQPSRVRAAPGERALQRRSCDGLVDDGRRAARRIDERLHGLARKTSRSRRTKSIGPDTAARCGIRADTCARCWAIGASARRRFSRASKRGRPRSPRSSQQSLYRPRSAAGRRRRLSTLAHLEDLLARGLVSREAGPPLEAIFRRA